MTAAVNVVVDGDDDMYTLDQKGNPHLFHSYGVNSTKCARKTVLLIFSYIHYTYSFIRNLVLMNT